MSDVRLSNEQLQIVESSGGTSIVVNAGTGTGKTTVLFERVIHLIKSGVSPQNILAIVFTDDEERRLRRLIQTKTGHSYKDLQGIGTFHSVFSNVLRKHITKVDPQKNGGFTIISIENENKRIRSISRALKTGALLDDECQEVRQLFREIRITGDTKGETMHLTNELVHKMYRQYQDFINKSNQVDLDEILILFHKVLDNHHEVREELSSIYKYILVDEMQDLNVQKWGILSHLIKKDHTVFLGVGDSNACLFMYDGSIPDIYEKVEEAIPGIVHHQLTKNYRSNNAIVNFCNEIKTHKDVELTAVSDVEGKIEQCTSDKSGVDHIVDETDYSKWVILYRFGKYLSRIQQTLEDRGIPYIMPYAGEEQNQYTQENSVSLVDIHNCKGREWDNVIVWKYRTIKELLVDVEDRNLAYVATSRARERLILCNHREKKIKQLSKRKYL